MKEFIDLIPLGRENAISIAELAKRSDLAPRTVRDMIQDLRDEHIGVSSGMYGCFLVRKGSKEDLEELKKCSLREKAQAKRRLKTSGALDRIYEREMWGIDYD